jgi:ribonuclease P protein subunit POP4
MYEEYVGLPLEVIDSKNKTLIGKKGKVINETQNTIVIEESNKKITVLLKKGSTFNINNKKINGNKIQKKPEDRVKLVRKAD